MKKVLKIIGIILLVSVVLVTVGLFAIVKLGEYKSAHYYENATTGGDIEKKYSELGSYDVSYIEFDAITAAFGKYAIWYPSKLESVDNKYPVVIWANGTGSTSSTYTAFLTHLSSWGFITVGNDDQDTRTGTSLEETIQFLIAENENKDSIFYHKIDLDHIGIGGHSQGGPAVFNMVTNQEHGYIVKTVYAVSATSSYHTAIFEDGWEYDISKVNVPVFLTAGTGSFDAGTATSKDQVSDEKNGIMQGICPLWSLQENYDLLPETIDKVIARKTNVDHGDSYLQFDGYMTAWFMWQLQGDQEAAKAFTGKSAELLNNTLYQDQRINIK